MPKVSPYEKLWEHIDNQTLIVTVNSRLAQTLNQSYLLYLKKKDKYPIVSQSILSYQNLLSFLVDAITTQTNQPKQAPSFYQIHQSRLLWLKVITDDYKKHPNEYAFFNIEEATDYAYDAYEKYLAWQLNQLENTSLNLYENHRDFSRFQRWLKSIKQHTKKDKIYLHSEQLLWLNNSLNSSINLTFKQLVFIGFNDYSPLLIKLFDALKKKNIKLLCWQLEPKLEISNTIDTAYPDTVKANTHIFSFQNSDKELSGIIKLIYQTYQNNPKKRIGLIVPDLHKIRYKLDDLLTETFYPNKNRLEPINQIDKPYTISGGIPLSDVPLIQTALMILSLKPVTSLNQLIRIIESPFTLTSESSPDIRNQLIKQIRKNYFETDSLKKMINDYKLSEAITEFKEAILFVSQDTKNITNDPIYHAFLRLKAFNFPGINPLSSENYQALTQFYQLFHKIKELQYLFNDLNYKELIDLLKWLSKTSIFQPESNPQASIYVLGILESSQQYFDQLFIIRMNDQLWPQKPNPNPLLPISLQKKLKMPNASNERELYFAKNISHSFFYQSSNLTISYSLFDGDSEQSLSPLITTENIKVKSYPLDRCVQLSTEICNVKLTKRHLSLAPLKKSINASSYLYQRFVQCHFKAQMQDRLKLNELGTFKKPLSAKDKGTLIHDILARIWQKVKTQANLKAFEPTKFNILIDSTIKETIHQSTYLAPPYLTHLNLVETKRIKNLLMHWFELEKSRDLSFKALSFEHRSNIQIGQLTSKNIRVDRVDQLDSGEIWLVDYKTSKKVQPNGWYDEKLTQPQLPLYALANNAHGIGFSQINGKSMTMSILYQASDHAVKLKQYAFDLDTNQTSKVQEKLITDYRNWHELKTSWLNQLTQMAVSFSQGDLTASINPSCLYCPYDGLCHYQQFKREVN
ncbi:PD-(D/E)XK nuclease family protein [Thiotrichales bacterium 19S11-10]|nr:PD-(D/E)XK nuclease family protein [Thiotrichales bacterium 19S11-10]